MNPGTRTLEPLLFPRTVAVIGAGRSGLGRLVLDHLVEAGFNGPIWAVHPDRTQVGAIPAFPRVEQLPEPPDLAVIALPRDRAVEAVEACAAIGCGSAVVISAGFSEVGPEGEAAQTRVVEAARRAGMRILGPNCMGLIHSHPGVRLSASFGVGPVAEGGVALLTQSGSIGDYYLYHCREWGLGVSLLASVGNEADVTLDELIQAAARDDRTRVIACYLERPARPEAVLRAIERASEVKPVVVLQGEPSGRWDGAIGVSTLEELMLACRALSRLPGGCGERVAMITNAGGPAVLAADAVSRSKRLRLVPLPRELEGARGRELPANTIMKGSVLDLTAGASADHFGHAVRTLRGRADGLACLIMSPEGTDPEPAVRQVLAEWSGPVSLCLLARGGGVEAARGAAIEAGAIVTREPALAIRALELLGERSTFVLCSPANFAKAPKKLEEDG